MAEKTCIPENRNLGIDLLRILAMWMVVTLHVEGHGGVLAVASGATARWVYLPECFAFCGVNCFGLISGYVGYQSRWRPAGFFALWCRVAFYSVGITALAGALHPGTVGASDLLHAAFPITFQSNDYWYFTAYAGLFFVIPLLRYLLRNLPLRHLLACCLVLLVGFSLLPLLMRRDLFVLRDGYTAVWLAVLYLVGGACHRTGLLAKVKSRTLVVVALCAALLTWAQHFVAPMLDSHLPGYAKMGERFFERDADWMNYTYPAVLVQALVLVVLFSRLRPSPRVGKVIAWAAPLSFSAYLIQNHPQTLQYLIKGRFAGYTALPGPVAVLAILATAAGIFIVCLGLDFLRARLFGLLHVQQGCAWLENLLRGGVNRVSEALLKLSTPNQ